MHQLWPLFCLLFRWHLCSIYWKSTLWNQALYICLGRSQSGFNYKTSYIFQFCLLNHETWIVLELGFKLLLSHFGNISFKESLGRAFNLFQCISSMSHFDHCSSQRFLTEAIFRAFIMFCKDLLNLFFWHECDLKQATLNVSICYIQKVLVHIEWTSLGRIEPNGVPFRFSKFIPFMVDQERYCHPVAFIFAMRDTPY